MRHLLLTFALSLHFVAGIYAQAEDITETFPYKNSFYGTVGFGGIYAIANANYERIVSVSDEKNFRLISIRMAYGRYALWTDGGPVYLLTLNGIWGKRNNHFEGALGVVVLFDKSSYDIGVSNANYPYPGYDVEPGRLDYTMFLPAASIGYRFQKPDGKFIFRAGIGWPEALYVSFGFAF